MLTMSETLPIDAVARANGVRLTIISLSYRTATPFFNTSFRTPDVTVHSQASPLVSLEVRHLLFPFISYMPSQHHFALSHHRWQIGPQQNQHLRCCNR